MGLFSWMAHDMYRDLIRRSDDAKRQKAQVKAQMRELRRIRARDDERSGRKGENSLRAYERKGVIALGDSSEVRARKILAYRGYPPDEVEQHILMYRRNNPRFDDPPTP